MGTKDLYTCVVTPFERIDRPERKYTYAFSLNQALRFFLTKYPRNLYNVTEVKNTRTGDTRE